MMIRIETMGRLLFRYRSFTPIPVILALLIFIKPIFPFGNEGIDELIDVAGWCIALIGYGIRMSVNGRWGSFSGLKTTGPYAYTRNPLYLGNFVIGLGMAVILGNLSIFFIFLLWFTVQYRSIIFAEECLMRAKFKNRYNNYFGAVPRFFPSIKANIYKTEGMPAFDWKLALKREHDCIFGWTIGALFFEMWEDIKVAGFYSKKEELFALSLMVILISVIWILVKAWKKRYITIQN